MFSARAYCIAHGTLLGVMWQPGWEESLGRMDTCICMAESLCCPPEAITTSLVGYTPYNMCLVAQLCPTLCNPVDCSPPGSSIHEDSPGQNTEVGSLSLLQGIFPARGSNPCLLHCRQILTIWATREANTKLKSKKQCSYYLSVREEVEGTQTLLSIYYVPRIL